MSASALDLLRPKSTSIPRFGLVKGAIAAALTAGFAVASLGLAIPVAQAATQDPSSGPVMVAPTAATPDNTFAHMGQGEQAPTVNSPLAKSMATPAFTQPLGTTRGIDVSKGQGTSIDWAAQLSAGIKFAYVAVGEGDYALNGNFSAQINGASGAGLLTGSYLLANPDYSSGAAQAQYFLTNSAGAAAGSNTLPQVVDLENSVYGNGDCYGVGPVQMVNWIRDYSSTIAAATGKLPAIYTTAAWWKECTNNSTAFSNVPLFLSAWSTSPGTIPSSWSKYTFWQYSEGPDATNSAIVGDLDIFNGSAQTLGTLTSSAPPVAPTFTDVSASNQFYTQINWLAATGVTTGYTDGTYRPVQPVDRDAMAAFMYRLAGSPAFTAPKKSPFKDVATNNEFYKEITWLAAQGISTGYTDGTYRPGAPVERDAMAAFLYRLAGSPAFTAPKKSPFKDVATNNQFYKQITWLAADKISTGYTDDTYRPGAAVNRDAMAAFMYRLVGE